MPLREFACERGHVEELLVHGADELLPSYCTALVDVTDPPDGRKRACLLPLRMQMSAPASRFPGASSWREGSAKKGRP